ALTNGESNEESNEVTNEGSNEESNNDVADENETASTNQSNTPTFVARNNNSTRSNSTNETTSRTTTNSRSTNHSSNTPKKSTKQKSTSAHAPKNSRSVLSAANSRLGEPYVSAGTRPGGFDCSGFVAWEFSQAGKNIPSY